VTARGRRARHGPLVVHLMTEGEPVSKTAEPMLPRAGVVVGRRVGPAVTRNLVKRRLREHLRTRLPALPEGSLVVVRALPSAADASFSRLGAALDSALRSLIGTDGRRS
jgi:ribonuclease P protein component